MSIKKDSVRQRIMKLIVKMNFALTKHFACSVYHFALKKTIFKDKE
jgi:hypothetical protein